VLKKYILVEHGQVANENAKFHWTF